MRTFKETVIYWCFPIQTNRLKGETSWAAEIFLVF